MSSLVGQSFGRYHILEQLGEGGMAIVFKAYDTRLETDVAVKVIRTDELSPKALEASRRATLPKSFWAWDEIVEMNRTGYWPYTPNTNLLYGLSESLDMLLEQGLPAVFARHARWAEGVRGAVRAWGLPIQCADDALHSPVLTGVITPQGIDADAIRRRRFRLAVDFTNGACGALASRFFESLECTLLPINADPTGELAQKVTAAQLETALWDVLKRVAARGVTEAELRRELVEQQQRL